MASVEAASNDTSLRYAPDDLTIPNPWFGKYFSNNVSLRLLFLFCWGVSFDLFPHFDAQYVCLGVFGLESLVGA